MLTDDVRKDLALKRLEDSGVREGQIYRHYKTRGLYSVVATAIDEAAMEPVVVYRSNAAGIAWTRSLDEFAGDILVAGVGTDGELGRVRVPRFRREAE